MFGTRLMATKRKREATKQGEDQSGPPHKKRRTQKGPPSSHLFQPESKDQQQYKEIFTAIYNSTFINNYRVPLNVIKHLSEFANGEFYECCNGDCEKEVSFLWKDVNAIDTRAVNCIYCSTKLYWHFCSIHNEYCTSTNISGKSCQTCHCTVCHKCISKCEMCPREICSCCISASNCCSMCTKTQTLF